jgi:regulator of sigma E protease
MGAGECGGDGMTLIYFIIALGALIFVHELGHFIVAKRAGICVEAFSLGFGPKLVGFKAGETEYRISALPFGGYVKMQGEEPGEEGASGPRSYSAKGPLARAKVILFGPLMNLFLCLALMPIVYMIGRSEPAYLSEAPRVADVKADSPAAEAGLAPGDLIVSVDGEAVSAWDGVMERVLVSPGGELDIGIERDGARQDLPVKVAQLPEIRGGYMGVEPMLFLGAEPRVDGVRAGGPADAAGMEKGDLVVSVGGAGVEDWLDLSRLVNESGGRETKIVVERDGQQYPLTVAAEFNKDFGRWVIGISKDRTSGVPMVVRRYGLWGSIVKGTKENIKLARMTFEVLGRLVTLKLSYKVLGGPILIAKTSAAAAATGLSGFLYFIAFLSLQLGILNLLPIPVLDGGQLLFIGIEGVMGRPLSLRVRTVAHHLGFALLISLMLLVTINDIDNVWGIKSLIGKIF